MDVECSDLEVTLYLIFDFQMSLNYDIPDELDAICKEMGDDPIQLQKFIFNGNVMRFAAQQEEMATGETLMRFVDPAHREEVVTTLKSQIDDVSASVKADEDAVLALKAQIEKMSASMKAKEEDLTRHRHGYSKMKATLDRIIEETEQERLKKEAADLEAKRQAELEAKRQEELEAKRQEEIRHQEELRKKKVEATESRKKKEDEERELKRQEDVRKSQANAIEEVQQLVHSMIPATVPFAGDATDDEMEIENEVIVAESISSETQSLRDFIAFGKQLTAAQKLYIIANRNNILV